MRIAIAGGTGVVGRYAVDIVRERGHTPVILARSAGVDLTTGHGLNALLEGTDCVIDVTSVQTQSQRSAERFFRSVTTNLLAAEQTAGVGHHIVLGIVGSDHAPFGYYAGKAVQENVTREGAVPWTILRSTQFHEFARQLYDQITLGPVHIVPVMLSRPVAAREVAERLVDLATTDHSGMARDIVGPHVLRMADMVRQYAAATNGRGPIIEIPLPGSLGKAMRSGALTIGTSADIGAQSFSEWLAALSGLADGAR